jgi:hypothetical protein
MLNLIQKKMKPLNNKPIIKKIPIKQLIDTLINLYEEGANYIDITGSEHTKTKDVLHIGVDPSYYKADNEEDSEPRKKGLIQILTEDDINNLI